MKKPPRQDDAPLAVFYGGTNGSGKSTLRYEYRVADASIEMHIDPDRIARSINSSDPRSVDLAAGRKALEFFDRAIAADLSFTLESTLTGNGIIKRIQKASDAGFKTELRYVGLESPDLNVERVSQRVAKGGHHIDEAVIRRRYDDSRHNLIKALEIADKVVIWDNSQPVFQLCATIINGKLDIQGGIKLPDWVSAFLKEVYPREFHLPTQVSLLENPALPSSNLSKALKNVTREKESDEELDP
jgi:predicted ABC-type ATPase